MSRGAPIIQGDEDLSMPLTRSAKLWNAFILVCTLAVLAPRPGLAQGGGTGTVTGRVTRSDDQSPLPSVSVTVESTGQSAVTGTDGRYTIRRVPEGPQKIVFRWLGYRPLEVQTAVEPNGTVTVEAAMEQVAV